ncbi:hypothetical protein [Anoxybacillus flavithermus]|uniref:hypothetical protein n=1 Tax=Anoxybacillus flavithermus TaxID=33934 RepID=UPI0007DA0CC6|nr:hypothetical protein [Anoxybacillus flavithermus]MBE2941643.1 hypothetical protein [Anoxybacillus flavithermus]MBE2944333.1 hypothetical protein [Anoxybacillus flavithermus]MBE2952546.1 hypothetical protein [Anoxybacillus flavithermus]MBE2955231.1 hypothetical protein [Anoxybacillus flavithermus]MBE2960582.1 hypothetical protein [Anoxybacillus flavithermus]
MSIIANKLNYKKMTVRGLLLMSLLAGTSAFALDTKSTAKLNGTDYAIGENINVWDGSAYVSATNNNVIYGDIAATIKKSLTLLPDPVQWNKIVPAGGSFSRTKISLPDESTYYAEASSNISKAYGVVTLQSD